MRTEEALGGSSRFEALHLALSSPYHLVRVLGPIVLPKPLLMVARQPVMLESSGVGAQLIRYQCRRAPPVDVAFTYWGFSPISLLTNSSSSPMLNGLAT